jgi:group II intron reverse transcriptase/maturase
VKIKERLETLRRLNLDPSWVNGDIFRLVCSPQLAVVAYEGLKSKQGNMTQGTDGTTLDETSLESLDALCASIRDESYSPVTVRRKMIPKPNGKLRPLGIPSPRDKIVQEMVRIVLDSIYDSDEPLFSEASHGFRPYRGCHSALKEFTLWKSLKWVIEGDIVGFFDNIDHHVLISALRKKISDERFLRLIWKFLRTPIRMEDGTVVRSEKGTPQGGVVSPILANIYLHEFDTWVEDLQRRMNRGGERRKANPEWRSLTSRRLRLLKLNGGEETDETKQLRRMADDLPSVDPNDPDFARVYYVRYADDWLIGVSGGKQVAEDVKSQAEAFLREKLHLQLSEEKTLITHAASERARFLGFELSTSGQSDRRRVFHNGKRVSTRRTRMNQPHVGIDATKILDKLKAAGFCRTSRKDAYFPCSKKNLVALEDHDIILRFTSVWRGIYNYFGVAANAHSLRRVQYVLQYSCLMTLGHKHRLGLPKAIAKWGIWPSTVITMPDGSRRAYAFWHASTGRLPLLAADKPHPDAIIAQVGRRLTRTSLTQECIVCGGSGVQMHHVRALRKGNKDITRGFTRLMSAINRKQVPLCKTCHVRVHRGEYDGVSLGELAYIPR